jgi:hypothetical protein
MLSKHPDQGERSAKNRSDLNVTLSQRGKANVVRGEVHVPQVEDKERYVNIENLTVITRC